MTIGGWALLVIALALELTRYLEHGTPGLIALGRGSLALAIAAQWHVDRKTTTIVDPWYIVALAALSLLPS